MSIQTNDDFLKDKFKSDMKMSDGKISEIVEAIKENFPDHNINLKPKRGNANQIEVDGKLINLNINFSHIYMLQKQNIDVTEVLSEMLTDFIERELKKINE